MDFLYLMDMTVYDFLVHDQENKLTSLFPYNGKMLLILVSAPHSSFVHWYEDLEKLYRKYREKGFEVLDFPCNQFLSQAFEDIHEIQKICERDYHTTFDRFQKVIVNGEGEEPLFTFLKSRLPFKGFDKGNVMSKYLATLQVKEHPDWEKTNDVKWNFTMFLSDRYGKPYRRFEPTSTIDKVEKALQHLIETQIID